MVSQLAGASHSTVIRFSAGEPETRLTPSSACSSLVILRTHPSHPIAGMVTVLLAMGRAFGRKQAKVLPAGSLPAARELKPVIDSHCHLDDPRFETDADQVLLRARRAGVVAMVCAGFGPARWERQRKLSAPVYLAFGMHPWEAARTDIEPYLQRLEQLLGGAVALGEIGLDRSRRCPAGTRPAQERAFRLQLRLARTLDLPVVLHVVRAHGRALDVLGEEGVPESGGMVHSYTGSAELVPGYLELGLHLSFSGAVGRLGQAQRVVRAVPEQRLLVETDAPDQTPPTLEGRNEPAYLVAVVDAVARLRGEPAQRVARASADNARRLFRLPSE